MPCVTIYSIYKCSGNAGNPLFRPSSHFRLFSGFSGISGMSLGLGTCRGCLPRAARHPATRPPRAAGPRHQSRPSPAPGILGAHPGLKYTYFWLGFFAFRIYSSKGMYCILYPSLPRFGSACMGCLLAAAPGPHPGLAGSSGRIAERSLLWGFSGMESSNIILFHFSRTRLDPYRLLAGSRSRSTCWPSGF